MAKLGELKKIDPRVIWKTENEFTLWLKNNLHLIAEEIGIELEPIEVESSVGSFYADIYAKDISNNRWVVIENQLEKTDHDHIGKLLTYASGKEASVVIWISPNFRPEHQQTVNWLNEIIRQDIAVFGILLEVHQIDDSSFAPYFRIVAQPNEWIKESESAPTPISSKQLKYQEFFTNLLEQIKNTNPNITQAKKVLPQNWFGYPVGHSRFWISTSFSQEKTFRTELYIDLGNSDQSLAAFNGLKNEKVYIESAIDKSLTWDSMDGRQACRIFIERQGTILDDPGDLMVLQEWALELVPKFHATFKPLIAKLKLK